jgi:polar amino acid transport system ATP-binding protein
MTAEVLDLIAALRAEGRDFVLATHQMGFARRVADHVAFIGGGGVVEHGPADEVLGRPRTDTVRQFLARVLAW